MKSSDLIQQDIPTEVIKNDWNLGLQTTIYTPANLLDPSCSEDPAWKALLLSFTIYMDFLRLVGKRSEKWGKIWGKIGLDHSKTWFYGDLAPGNQTWLVWIYSANGYPMISLYERGKWCINDGFFIRVYRENGCFAVSWVCLLDYVS